MYKALASSCLAVSFNGAFLISCSSCLEIKLKKKNNRSITTIIKPPPTKYLCSLVCICILTEIKADFFLLVNSHSSKLL